VNLTPPPPFVYVENITLKSLLGRPIIQVSPNLQKVKPTQKLSSLREGHVYSFERRSQTLMADAKAKQNRALKRNKTEQPIF